MTWFQCWDFVLRIQWCVFSCSGCGCRHRDIWPMTRWQVYNLFLFVRVSLVHFFGWILTMIRHRGSQLEGTNLFILIILAGDIEMNPGPRFQCGLCKKYYKASDRLLECEECEKRFHASCSNLGDNELLRIESGNGAWYRTNRKADCGLCSSTVLKGHKAVRCDSCDMWIHNECSFITETQYETVNNTNRTWICPKCEFFSFSDSFFGKQVNVETENRFVPLTKEKKDRSSPCGTNKSSFISGLKFISMNINSIRGKKLELLAFLDFHQPHVVAIQETKIDSSIATSELFSFCGKLVSTAW